MKRLTLILLIAPSAFCQQSNNPTFTGVMGNGRLWASMDYSQKAVFVEGMREALIYKDLFNFNGTGINKAQAPANLFNDWAEGFGVEEYMKETDKVYRDTENTLIPIVMVIEYCTVKFTTNQPKLKLDAVLAALREFSFRLRKIP